MAGYDAAGALSTWSIDGYPADTQQLASRRRPRSRLPSFSLPTHAPNDFNGDGNSDLLFTDGTQTLATWELNGSGLSAAASLGAPGPT